MNMQYNYRSSEGNVIAIIITVAILIGLVALVFLAMSAECAGKTAFIGFPHKFTFFGGCLIEPLPGQWIPLENWRMFGQ